MAATFRTETAPAVPTAPVADPQQWWADVQSGVSAMLTEAAHAGVPQRLAS